MLNIENDSCEIMGTENKMKDTILGKNRDKMPNFLFRVMTVIMRLIDFLNNSSGKNFKTLNLKQGQVVVDYGCGPARYIENASKAVGTNGKVYAVDIHPLAIENVNTKIKQKQLKNVEAVLADGYSTSLKDKSIDVIYALDMFHMISSPLGLLREFHRILKDDGIAIIEDGHQKRSETLQKVNRTYLFRVVEETNKHIKCKKMNN